MEALRKILYFLPRLILFSIFIVYGIFALLTYFDYFEQFLFPLHFVQGDVQKLSENIYIGPYPHFDELKRLQKETGIDVVISLLSQDLPQERALFNRESNIADRLGIKLYNYPMSYFDLRGKHNKQTAAEVTAVIKGLKDKKIYIHCYLGRHRVNLVKNYLLTDGLISELPVHDSK
jgi:hypothetical protein